MIDPALLRADSHHLKHAEVLLEVPLILHFRRLDNTNSALHGSEAADAARLIGGSECALEKVNVVLGLIADEVLDTLALDQFLCL